MTSAFTHDTRELAETYHRVSELQLEGGKRLVERLAVGEGSRVLDVGCGTGRLTSWIAERVGEKGVVAGVDPLEERIHLARAQGGRATFEVARAEDLHAFGDASFDVVCMSSVLHWVDDQAKALAEARRVLRAGGLLGLTTSTHELSRAGTLGRVFESVLSREPYAGRVDSSMLTFAKQRTTTTELITLIDDSGLELQELEVKRSSRAHASGAALLEFVEASAFGTFLAPVPEPLRSTLRAELITSFDSQGGPDGIGVVGWGVLLVAKRLPAESRGGAAITDTR